MQEEITDTKDAADAKCEFTTKAANERNFEN